MPPNALRGHAFERMAIASHRSLIAARRRAAAVDPSSPGAGALSGSDDDLYENDVVLLLGILAFHLQ